MRSTATSSPLPGSWRTNGSDHSQIPVVFRSRPPRHEKPWSEPTRTAARQPGVAQRGSRAGGQRGRGARARTAAADGAREGVLVALEILAVDEQPVIRAGGRGGGAALGAQVAQEEVEQEGLARAEGPRHRHHRHLHARRHFVEDLGQRRLLELELARILLDRDDLHGGHRVRSAGLAGGPVYAEAQLRCVVGLELVSLV